jgi:hypothetical protein
MLLLPASSRCKRGVQRGGLAGACRPRDQDDAVRLGDQVLEALQHLALHAHGFQAQLAFGLVQQPQHGPLAMGAGQRRDPHIHRTGADAQRDASVLRQAFFGDVQVGHDLQARDQRRVQGAVGLHHLAQRAVHLKRTLDVRS